MVCKPSEKDRLNCYALVSYIPDPLGKFLDDLRRELVPAFKPRAHVTILPPRPLASDAEEAIDALRWRLADVPPFELEAAEVEIFPVTDVVYIEIGKGKWELLRMHRAMNRGPLAFQEPFHYHPHITLAQELEHEQSVKLAEVARCRWAEFRASRRWTVETLAFVQNTAGGTWIDLAHLPLAALSSVW